MLSIVDQALELYRKEFGFFLEPIESKEYFHQWLNSQEPQIKKILGGISPILMAMVLEKEAAKFTTPAEIFKEFPFLDKKFQSVVQEYQSAVKALPHDSSLLTKFLDLEVYSWGNIGKTSLAKYIVENKEFILKAAQSWNQTNRGRNIIYCRNLITNSSEEVRSLVHMDFDRLDVNQDPVTYKEKADAIIEIAKENAKFIYSIKNKRTLEDHLQELKPYLSATSLKDFENFFTQKLTDIPGDFEQEISAFIGSKLDSNEKSNAEILRLRMQELDETTILNGDEIFYLRGTLPTMARQLDPELFPERASSLIEDALKKAKNKAANMVSVKPYDEIPVFTPKQEFVEQVDTLTTVADSKTPVSGEIVNAENAKQNSMYLETFLFLAENTGRPHLSTGMIQKLKDIDLNLNTDDYEKQILKVRESQEQYKYREEAQQINNDFDRAVGETTNLSHTHKSKDDLNISPLKDGVVKEPTSNQKYEFNLKIIDDLTALAKISLKADKYVFPLINHLIFYLSNYQSDMINQSRLHPQNDVKKITGILEKLITDIQKIGNELDQLCEGKNLDSSDKYNLKNLTLIYEAKKNEFKRVFIKASKKMIALNEKSPSLFSKQAISEFVKMTNVIRDADEKETAEERKLVEEREINTPHRTKVPNLSPLQFELVQRLESCYENIAPNSKYSLLLFSIIERIKNSPKLESHSKILRNIKKDLEKMFGTEVSKMKILGTYGRSHKQQILTMLDCASDLINIRIKNEAYLLPLTKTMWNDLTDLIKKFSNTPHQKGLEKSIAILAELKIDIAKIQNDMEQICKGEVVPNDNGNLTQLYENQKNELKSVFIKASEKIIALNEISHSPVCRQTISELVKMGNIIRDSEKKETHLSPLQIELVERLESCYKKIAPQVSKYSLMLFSIIEKIKNSPELESSSDHLQSIKEDLEKLKRKVSGKNNVSRFFEPAEKLQTKSAIEPIVNECLKMVNSVSVDQEYSQDEEQYGFNGPDFYQLYRIF